jgi:hypothetical protein
VFLLGVCAWWLAPIQASFKTLRDEGEVAALAPVRDRVDRNSPAGEAAIRRVVRAVLPLYRRDRALLDPILESTRRKGVRRGLAQLEAWTALRRAWAEALRREGLTIASYRQLAREVTLPDAEHEPRLGALLEPATRR